MRDLDYGTRSAEEKVGRGPGFVRCRAHGWPAATWGECLRAETHPDSDFHPSEPDPVSETVAKAIVAGGVIAVVGYRYYKQRSPRG